MKIIIQENIPLAPYTTMKVGGPAKYFCETSSEEEILEAVNFAQNNNLPIFVLAGGSNVVISDQGFGGLVIKIRNSKFEIQNSSIQCSAGVRLSEIVGQAAKNGLTGFEWAAGIPGTVGGAVRGNAGAYDGEMKDSIESVRCLEISNSPNCPISNKIPNSKFQIPNKFQNLIKNLKGKECGFGYRASIFKENKNLIIISVVLSLQKGEKTQIERKINEIIAKRKERLPMDPSVGSFFQNPTVSDRKLIELFEKDMNCQCREGKIPAGWLIEEAGLRGKKMGQVMVSEKHANFVINLGGGRAEEIVMLASFLKQQVRDKLGVGLKEEAQYVGFSD